LRGINVEGMGPPMNKERVENRRIKSKGRLESLP
jgi:hypothetical protein